MQNTQNTPPSVIDYPLPRAAARLPYREGALSLKEVPKRMAIIGGGIIGLELGSVWCRLGSEVTVIEFAKDICPPMDAQIRKTFQRSLKKQGINFMMQKKVTSAKKTPTGVKLTVEPSAGKGGGALAAPSSFFFFLELVSKFQKRQPCKAFTPDCFSFALMLSHLIPSYFEMKATSTITRSLRTYT